MSRLERTPWRRTAPLGRGESTLTRTPLERTPMVTTHRSTGPTRRVVDLLADRAARYTGVDGGVPLCEICGLLRAATAHHRDPRGMGGTRSAAANRPVNLILVCDPCHRQVESHRADAYREGWLVHTDVDPATVPVWLGGAYFLLSDDGSRVLYTEPEGTTP